MPRNLTCRADCAQKLKGERSGIPHLAKNERDVGHPAGVAGTELFRGGRGSHYGVGAGYIGWWQGPYISGKMLVGMVGYGYLHKINP
jgi:hypothetical protein